MASPPKSQAKTRPNSGKSKPISFRLDTTLVDHIDVTAERLFISRNRLVAFVLMEYLNRRMPEVERIVEQEENRASHIDLFA